MQNWKERGKAVYARLNTLSGGALDVLKDAVQHFGKVRATQAAASMAYYAVFSLFPLALGLIVVGSFVLESEQAQQEVIQFFTDAFPASQNLIEQNIEHVLDLRGPVGIIGLVSLLWSGSGVFSTLAYNVNLAWPEAEARNLLEKRLVALGMIGALVGLLLLSLVSTTVLNLLPRLEIPLGDGVSIYETPIWTLVSNLVPLLFTFLLFFSLYRWVPSIAVSGWEALWGALVAAIGWEIATRAFTWYLRSGTAQYELVYGSLGAVVALMFWVYLSSLVTFFGAHLCAAIARQAQAHV